MCFPLRARKWGSRRSGLAGRAELISLAGSPTSENNDEQQDEEKMEASSSPFSFLQKWESTWGKIEKSSQAIFAKLPQPLVNVVKAIVVKLFELRWQLVSFAAGAVLTVAAIIVPIYSQVETLSKPVTLFETILGDLEQAYVDPVDTDKLFETRMAAMLR